MTWFLMRWTQSHRDGQFVLSNYFTFLHSKQNYVQKYIEVMTMVLYDVHILMVSIKLIKSDQ